MRIKLTNETHFQSEHLLGFLRPIVKEELDGLRYADYEVGSAKIPGRPVRSVKVVVKYGRHSGRLGEAAGTDKFYLFLHKNLLGGCRCGRNTEYHKKMLAQTIAHECAHLRGMSHRRMRGMVQYTWTEGWQNYYAKWAELPLGITMLNRKPEPSREVKVLHLQELLTKWTRKAKLAATKIKKLKKRIAYYTKEVQNP